MKTSWITIMILCVGMVMILNCSGKNRQEEELSPSAMLEDLDSKLGSEVLQQDMKLEEPQVVEMPDHGKLAAMLDDSQHVEGSSDKAQLKSREEPRPSPIPEEPKPSTMP